jgi:hypothetical protein
MTDLTFEFLPLPGCQFPKCLGHSVEIIANPMSVVEILSSLFDRGLLLERIASHSFLAFFGKRETGS